MSLYEKSSTPSKSAPSKTEAVELARFRARLRTLLNEGEAAEANAAEVKLLLLKLEGLYKKLRHLKFERIRAITSGAKPRFWGAVDDLINQIPEEWR